jgi:hypothetical protein
MSDAFKLLERGFGDVPDGHPIMPNLNRLPISVERVLPFPFLEQFSGGLEASPRDGIAKSAHEPMFSTGFTL